MNKPSVPGVMPSHSSATAAYPVRTGLTATHFAPRAFSFERPRLIGLEAWSSATPNSMEKALRKAQAEIPPPAFTDVDQVFAQGEEHIAAVIAAAVDEMRPKYGKWMGFEQWAPLNAEAVRAYIIVGN